MYFPHEVLHVLSSRIDGLQIGRHVLLEQLYDYGTILTEFAFLLLDEVACEPEPREA